ncbi:MAG: hypothetical protein ACR2PL_26890 [Dehalococcoidia bacterium]
MIGQRAKMAIIGSVGGAATLGAVVLGGAVFAQTPSSSPSPSSSPGITAPAQGNAQKAQTMKASMDDFLNSLAKNLGIDRSKLDGALKTTADQQIDTAVQSGKLTQQQGQQRKDAIANGQIPFGTGGFMGRGHGVGDNADLQPIFQTAHDTVTKALGGETDAQLRTEIQSGKTFDQIAQEHQTTVQAIETSVVNAIKPQLDALVQQGKLTQTQETDLLSGIQNGKIPGVRGGHEERPDASPDASPRPTQ